MTSNPRPSERLRAARKIATALQVDPKQPGTRHLAMDLRPDAATMVPQPSAPPALHPLGGPPATTGNPPCPSTA